MGNDAVVPLLVCAHGAGGSMADRAMLATAEAFREHGIGVVQFNFLYAAVMAGMAATSAAWLGRLPSHAASRISSSSS
jgi:predicted alpha/beta-hydrolase family hydrolase